MRLCLPQSWGLHQTLLIDHERGRCLCTGVLVWHKEANKAGAVGLQERKREEKREERREGAAQGEGKQEWDREERREMHQEWSVGVCLLMQSLTERGREEERGRVEKGILADHVCIMHMQSCRSNLDKIFKAQTWRHSQQWHSDETELAARFLLALVPACSQRHQCNNIVPKP